MVKDYDKPEYVNVVREDGSNKVKEDSKVDFIKELCQEQSFGVLATAGNDQCFTSLITFETSEDLREIVFATPVDTKKFKSIKENKKVSLLIDNRSNNPDSINKIVALTAIGNVSVLEDEDSIEKWSRALVDKHSYLDEFIKAKSTAIILMKVSKYYYVSSFQEVIEWNPNS